MNEIRKTNLINEIDDLIDRAYAPSNMKPEEALEFLGHIAENVRAKIDALKEENDLE